MMGHFCNEGRTADFTQLLFAENPLATKMYQDHARNGKMKQKHTVDESLLHPRASE